MSVNKVVLVGRLGNKPDGKYTPSGLSVCTFSMATNEIWMNAQKEKQEHTEWHNIVTWNKTADFVSDNLDKGDMVYVEGKIRTRKYTTKDNIERRITEIIATNLVALSYRNKKSNNEEDVLDQNNVDNNIESNKIDTNMNQQHSTANDIADNKTEQSKNDNKDEELISSKETNNIDLDNNNEQNDEQDLPF